MVAGSLSGLVSISAMARSGATEAAWKMFCASGLDTVADDATVLSVKGRLLKDLSGLAEGAERQRLLAQAGDAYASASGLSGATYPLINAASLAFLAGDLVEAEARALHVLEKLDRGDTGPETPYYLSATRAEALLLLYRYGEATVALHEAITLAPRAWEDHASTLRQFRRILTAQAASTAWLSCLLAPRSLHFAGAMTVGPTAVLDRTVREFLRRERIGFAYGALAAGADIVVAEAVLAEGAELHLILPTDPDRFAAQSVAGFGPDWRGRYDAILDKVESVRIVDTEAGLPGPAEVMLAGMVAMGLAAIKAESLASEAVQLVLVDTDAERSMGGSATSQLSAKWQASGRQQWVIDADGQPSASGAILDPKRGDTTDSRLSAIMLVKIASQTANGANLPGLATEGNLVAIWHAVQTLPSLAKPVVFGEVIQISLERPEDVVVAVSAIANTLSSERWRIAVHFGVMNHHDNPFGTGTVLSGPLPSLALQLLTLMPDHAVWLTDTFLAVLHAGNSEGSVRTHYVGELEGQELHALLRQDLS